MLSFGLHKIIDSKAAIPVRVSLGLPRNWESVPTMAGKAYMNVLSGLRVIISLDTMEGGETWWHVSLSYPDKLPSWEDVKSVKDAFIGEDREAFQLLPRQEEYVNLHQYCLHLWAREEKTPCS
jgi:hypothetical protein